MSEVPSFKSETFKKQMDLLSLKSEGLLNCLRHMSATALDFSDLWANGGSLESYIPEDYYTAELEQLIEFQH